MIFSILDSCTSFGRGERAAINRKAKAMKSFLGKRVFLGIRISALTDHHAIKLKEPSSFYWPAKRYNVTQAMLSLLRERGPIPISKISPELSDSDLEEVSESGKSIIDLLKLRSDVVVMTIKKSLHIAFLKDMLQHVECHHKQGVAFLLASVAALHHFPRTFSSSHVCLSTIHTEMLLRIAMKEGLSSMFDSTDAIHRVLHRYPSLFKLERSGQVRLALPSPAPSTQSKTIVETAPSLASSFGCQLPVKQNMLLSALRKGLSEAVYIQLKVWLSSTSAFWRSLPLEDLLGRLDQLQKNNPPLIDVRKFGEGVERIFLRLLARHAEGLSIEEEKKKNVLVIQQKLFSLGNQAARELQEFISQSRENYLSMMKGLTMSQIGEILSPEVQNQTLQLLFSDLDSGTEYPQESLILLFDRFRHIFDVNFHSGTIRLWSVLPPSEQPSTLTWESSPLPMVLRHLLTSLQLRPKTPQELYEALPSELQWQLHHLYGQEVGREPRSEASILSPAGNSKEQICLFISHHSMFMFLDHDGLVYTPQLVISQKQKKVLNLSDNEKAVALYNALPPSGAVDFMTFLMSDVGRQLPFSTKNISESFVSRFPTFFRLYSPFASHRTVVGRVGVPPPPANFLNPSFESPEDMIKFIALHAVGGVTESAIVNNLSKEGRAWLKRIGTPTEIAEQLPMWFDVRRDKFNGGASLITYIPGSRENASVSASSTLSLKLVFNDREYEVEAKKKDEEWNEEWNEASDNIAQA